MRLRVDLIPKGPYSDVVVLIDVLRSCTVAPILFEQGLEKLYLCPSLRLARAVAKEQDYLLLGERGGLPPEGFNYGNSPAFFINTDFSGQSAVLVSENLPKAISNITGAKHLLLGSLYNAEAVIHKAFELASEEIALVCCGMLGSEDLDDSFTAGYLAARLKRADNKLELRGAAAMTLSLFRAFPNPLEALWHSRTGHYLRSLGLEEDLAISSYISQSEAVPGQRETIAHERANLYCFDTKL